jgi:excisionase family DNA binding protein
LSSQDIAASTLVRDLHDLRLAQRTAVVVRDYLEYHPDPHEECGVVPTLLGRAPCSEDSMAAKIALELTELPPTLSIERAAKLLGLSRSSAYRAAANGQLPTLAFGRRLFVPTVRLLEMLGFPIEDRPCCAGAFASAGAPGPGTWTRRRTP